MIASTPVEAFQCELLGKAKGYKLIDALAEGRRFEAILAVDRKFRNAQAHH